MKAIASLVALTALVAGGAPAVGQRARAKPAAPASKAAAKPVPAIWYDFKGAKLGMSLEEWKALPLPIAPRSYSSRDDGPERIWCSNDRTPDGKDVPGFYLSKAEKALGVVYCAYGSLTTMGSYSELKHSEIKIGDNLARDIDYKFLDGRLFEISITGSESLLSDILDGLNAKFGPPTSVVDDTTQNKAGATFPHTEKVWRSSVASIHLETPFSRIDDLNVTYMAQEAVSRIAAKERELNPAAEKM